MVRVTGKGHLFNPEYNKNNNFKIFSNSISIGLSIAIL